MADKTRSTRTMKQRLNWDKNKIDASKISLEADRPKFNKQAYDELMAYATELKNNQKK